MTLLLTTATASVLGLIAPDPVAPPPSEAPTAATPSSVGSPADAGTADPKKEAADAGDAPVGIKEPVGLERSPSGAVPVADPLPPAPPSVPASSLRNGSWRGRGWFQIGLDVTLPLAGTRPGRGSVRSAAGGVGAGWRPRPWLGLGGGVSTFFHDSETRIVDNDLSGQEEEASDFGRMTLFDVPQVRLFLPTKGRVEPWLEAAAAMGVYHEPWGSARWVAGGRAGIGVGFWLGPAFSLDLSAVSRMLVVGGTTGWMLQAGFGATIHW